MLRFRCPRKPELSSEYYHAAYYDEMPVFRTPFCGPCIRYSAWWNDEPRNGNAEGTGEHITIWPGCVVTDVLNSSVPFAWVGGTRSDNTPGRYGWFVPYSADQPDLSAELEIPLGPVAAVDSVVPPAPVAAVDGGVPQSAGPSQLQCTGTTSKAIGLPRPKHRRVSQAPVSSRFGHGARVRETTQTTLLQSTPSTFSLCIEPELTR